MGKVGFRAKTWGVLLLMGISLLLPASRPNIRFRLLGQDDGLIQPSVNAIFQCSRGFMWFGTQGGLHRYDGYRLRVFKNANYLKLEKDNVY